MNEKLLNNKDNDSDFLLASKNYKKDLRNIKIERTLGKGANSTVYEVEINKKLYAMKKIEIEDKTSSEVYRELSIFIKCANNPSFINFIGYDEYYDEEANIYYMCILMEKADGSLNNYLEKVDHISLDTFKCLLQSTILGLTFLQKIHKVAHRDIKPLNILVSNNSFKLSDFGESKYYKRIRNEKNTLRGTPLYLAPEIIKAFEKKEIGFFDEEIIVNYFKSDVYSLGLVFYEFLLRNKITKAMRKNLLQLDFLERSCSIIKQKYNKSISDLLFRMLNPNPENRPDFTDILASASKENLIYLVSDDYKMLNMMQMEKNELSPQLSNDYIYIYKVVLIGSSGCGKTSILDRYCENTFRSELATTIGVDYKKKKILIKKYGVNIALQIWDTAGQERFRHITREYFLKSAAILIVTDEKDKYQEFDYWVNNAKNWCSNYNQMVLYLVLNKNDLDGTCMKEENLKNHALEKNLKFYSVSAKTGNYIDSLFEDVACDIYNKFSVPINKFNNNLIDTKNEDDDDRELRFNEKGKPKSCCYCCKVF